MNDTAISLRLGAWWEANARDLPWRFGRATPWGVLVSEVMSQQTQMSRVVPYWTDWMERWPDARALAEAPKAEVITAWGRLGYPRRALRLQECACVVAEQYADKLPRTYDELTALPGVGDYTASAVMSFAFGERIAVIDTNIRRVLSRVFLGGESRGERPVRPNVRWRTACCPKTRFSDAMLTSPIMPVAPNMPRTALSGATNAPDCIVANAHRSHGTSR